MPLDGAAWAAGRAAALSVETEGLGTHDLLDLLLGHPLAGRLALVSSFGAESVVLLHLIAARAPQTPVLFLNTQMLFEETLSYQIEVAETLGLTDVRHIRPDDHVRSFEDPDGTLHQRDPDRCCDLRKTQPLAGALAGFDGWMTGRKRFQSGSRAALPRIEADGADRVKINPLAEWSAKDVAAYFDQHALPRHPLVAKGYPSVGCAPCTSPVARGEDTRAGRWRGQSKDECGIHFINGRALRGPMQEIGA